MKSNLGIVATCFIAVGLVVSMAGCADSNRQTPASREVRVPIVAAPGIPQKLQPTPAPHFERLTAAGDTFRLADQRGRVVVANFWATWCAPCVREIPDLVALDSALRDSGLTVVGISMDHEGFDAVRTFLQPFDPAYSVVLDEGLATEFGGIAGLPATFLIDRAGRIVQRIDGLARPDVLRRAVRDLLAKAGPSGPTAPSGSG